MAPVCVPTLKKTSLWHPFMITKQILPLLSPELLTQRPLKSFSLILHMQLSGFLSSTTFYAHVVFLVSFISLHTFYGLAVTCVNPGSIFQTLFLCIHLFVK